MKHLAIILVLIAAFISAVSVLFIKKSTNKGFRKMFKRKLLWTGFGLYGLSTIVYLTALKRGELSVLYPMVSTTYIWTSLLSIKFLNERLNKWKIISLLGIILGIVFIGIGS